MMLAMHADADKQVRAIALDALNDLDTWLAANAARERDASWRAHYALARFSIERMRDDPSTVETIVPVAPPPGEPIGTAPDFELPF